MNVVRKLSFVALIAVAAPFACEDAVPGQPHEDASIDASLPDAVADSPSSDGDSVLSEEAAAPSYCDIVTPKPIFCDDFEGPFKAVWDNANRVPDRGETGGGKILLDTAQWVSKPFSARLQTPALVDSSQAAWAILMKSIHSPPPDMMIEGEFRIDTEYLPDGGTKLVPLLIAHFQGAGMIFIYRSTVGTALSVSPEGGPAGQVIVLSGVFEVGKWKTVSLVIRNRPLDDSSPDGEVVVRLDELDAAQTPLPASFQTSPEVEVIYGPTAIGPIGDFAVNLDNVRVYDRSDL